MHFWIQRRRFIKIFKTEGLLLKELLIEKLSSFFTFCYSLDLNAAESGVQHKPSTGPRGTNIGGESSGNKDSCSC